MATSLDPEQLLAENRALKLENQQLRSESDELRKEAAELRERLAELVERVETLRSSQSELLAATSATDERLRWLKARMRVIEREVGQDPDSN